MDVQQRLDELLSLAESIGLTVRREPLGGEGGGLCVLRGKRVLFVDDSADAETRYERTVAALCDTPDLDARFVRPEIRQDLDRARRTGG